MGHSFLGPLSTPPDAGISAMRMGGAPGQKLVPQQSFCGPRSEQQEGLGRQGALWALHEQLWDWGQKGINTQERGSSLGFQTTMQKKGGRWQT